MIYSGARLGAAQDMAGRSCASPGVCEQYAAVRANKISDRHGMWECRGG